MFRMTRRTFCDLLTTLSIALHRPHQRATNYRRETITADVRLGATLGILAGAEVLDVCHIFQIGNSTAYNVLHETVNVMNSVLRFPKLPREEDALHAAARDFKLSRSQFNPLDGCVGALDGICMKLKKPKNESIPASFYCRKGYYAIPVQAVCDSNYLFRYASGLCGGATHDSLANAVSGFMEEVQDGLLGEIFWVAGDEAYPVSEWIIVPYPASTLTDDEDNFNFYLSSLRIHIEQAFGMLTARWRLLRDRLNFSLRHCSNIMSVCMKLHNYCVEEDSEHGRRSWDGVKESLLPGERAELEIDRDRFIREMKELNRTVLRRCRDTVASTRTVPRRTRSTVPSRKREVLKNIVKEKGLIRPPMTSA